MINQLLLREKDQQHTKSIDTLSRNNAGWWQCAPAHTDQFSLAQLRVSSGRSAVQCEEMEAEERVQYPYVTSPFNRA